MNWVDFVILAIITWNSLLGLNRGLILSVFNLVGFVIAGYIAKLYHPTLATYISNNPKVSQWVDKLVSGRVDKAIENNTTPQDMGSVLDIFKFPQAVKDGLVQNPQLQGQTELLAHDFSETMTQVFADTVINIISILIIFMVARFVLQLIARTLHGIAELPILKQVNKMTGLFFGFAVGILVVYLTFVFLIPVISMSPEGFIAKGTFESVLGYRFYSNNIILYYLKLYGIF